MSEAADMNGNSEVDAYLHRSRLWPAEIAALRPILLGHGLTEAIKWGKPCYSHEGANIVICQEMKDHLSLMFFKGALIADPEGVLEDQGPNSRSARRIRFTSVDEVERLRDTVVRYLDAAIEAERAGLQAGPAPEPEYVDELLERFEADPELEAAFESLTPGRRRAYHLYFSEPKQSATRTSRIDKYVGHIKDGKGLRDR